MATRRRQDAAPSAARAPCALALLARAQREPDDVGARGARAARDDVPAVVQRDRHRRKDVAGALSLTAFARSRAEALVLLDQPSASLALLFVRGERRAPGAPAPTARCPGGRRLRRDLLIVYGMFVGPAAAAPRRHDGTRSGASSSRCAAAIWLASTGAVDATAGGRRAGPRSARARGGARRRARRAARGRAARRATRARSVTFELPTITTTSSDRRRPAGFL